MSIEVHKCGLSEILPLRDLFLQEANVQIRYNTVHKRGWSDSYKLLVDGQHVGYGSVMGQEVKNRDTIFEFFVTQPYRNWAKQLLEEMIAVTKVRFIECQTNVPLLASLLPEFASSISSPVILFGDSVTTHLPARGFKFRKRQAEDSLFPHQHEPEGTYVILFEDEVVATGGFLLHYNPPFADLYMEVRPDFRKRGAGSYLIQEIKKECYLAGRWPAARCNADNEASRAALIKAGFKITGHMQLGILP